MISFTVNDRRPYALERDFQVHPTATVWSSDNGLFFETSACDLFDHVTALVCAAPHSNNIWFSARVLTSS